MFRDVTPGMRIAQEEIFGPVVAMLPYEDEDDAVAIANDSDFGLHGSVWTPDVGHGVEVARRVRTGTYSVNGLSLDPAAPFGGVKQSGLGRELGPEGLSAYLSPGPSPSRSARPCPASPERGPPRKSSARGGRVAAAQGDLPAADPALDDGPVVGPAAQVLAAVDVDDLAGHPAGARRQQEGHRLRDVVDVLRAAERGVVVVAAVDRRRRRPGTPCSRSA